MKLRVFNIIKNTKVEGPGNRYCIWVQGCSRHCKGCQAVHTWPHSGGELYDVEDIIEDILNNIAPSPQPCLDLLAINGYRCRLHPLLASRSPEGRGSKSIEGVTFLGGEPFEQAEALGEIAYWAKNNMLGVLCFTGDVIENLKKEYKNKKHLDNIDLLIDGAFELDKIDYSRPWCGSSNQRYHFLTDRYNEEIFTRYQNKVEVNISKNGQIFLNGMGDFDKILNSIDLKQIK